MPLLPIRADGTVGSESVHFDLGVCRPAHVWSLRRAGPPSGARSTVRPPTDPWLGRGERFENQGGSGLPKRDHVSELGFGHREHDMIADGSYRGDVNRKSGSR